MTVPALSAYLHFGYQAVSVFGNGFFKIIRGHILHKGFNRTLGLALGIQMLTAPNLIFSGINLFILCLNTVDFYRLMLFAIGQSLSR